jgi:hypothetical protein
MAASPEECVKVRRDHPRRSANFCALFVVIVAMIGVWNPLYLVQIRTTRYWVTSITFVWLSLCVRHVFYHRKTGIESYLHDFVVWIGGPLATIFFLLSVGAIFFTPATVEVARLKLSSDTELVSYRSGMFLFPNDNGCVASELRWPSRLGARFRKVGNCEALWTKPPTLSGESVVLSRTNQDPCEYSFDEKRHKLLPLDPSCK